MPGSALMQESILCSVFLHLDDKEAKVAANVCKGWAAACDSDALWSMKAEQDGVGALRPVLGVSNRAFYRSFSLLRPGRVEWLVWWDDLTEKWEVDSMLLQAYSALQAAAPLATVTVCAPSGSLAARTHAACLFFSMMRATAASNARDELTTSCRRGIQVWSNPSILSNGQMALFMFAQGLHAGAREVDPEDERSEQIAATAGKADEALRCLLLCLSSQIIAVDDEDATGTPWWEPLFPHTLPKGDTATGPINPAPGPGLIVVSSADVMLPSCTTVSEDRRASVARWVCNFDEVTLLNSQFYDADWAASLADDTIQSGSSSWGSRTPVLLPSAVWKAFGALKIRLADFPVLLDKMLEHWEAAGQRASAWFTEEFEEMAVRAVLDNHIGLAVSFYREAMFIELETGRLHAADMAHHGEAAESPAEVPVPLKVERLVESHEQHYFAACRRLIFFLGDAGIEPKDAFRFFELLKMRISDEFRVAWCLNQSWSKVFCEAIFDSVFSVVREKYVLEEDETASVQSFSTHSSLSSTVAKPPSTKLSHPSTNHETSSRESIDKPRRSKPSLTDPELLDTKQSVKNLKRFFQTFVDRLDEYNLKAIGTRRGDVMLCKANDLLGKVEANQSGLFHASDFSQAMAHLTKELTSRMMQETVHMERTRCEMQKTCALYTKLLGLQCRQHISGCNRNRWAEALPRALGVLDAKSQLCRTVLGTDEGVLVREDAEAQINVLIEQLTASEDALRADSANFMASLPTAEKDRYCRFGVVNKKPLTSSNMTKARAMFSRFKNKFSAK